MKGKIPIRYKLNGKFYVADVEFDEAIRVHEELGELINDFRTSPELWDDAHYEENLRKFTALRSARQASSNQPSNA
jgi:hypothetical protein